MFQNQGSHNLAIRFYQRRTFFLFSLLFICILGLLSFIFIKIKAQPNKPLPSNSEIKDSKVGMANPAAVYCQTLGYEYQIVKNSDGSQSGKCIFSGGESCGDWDFLQGKCGEKYSYCVKQGYDIKTVKDGKDPLSVNYAVCVSKKDGKIVGSVTDLTGLIEKSIKVKQSSQNQLKQNVSIGSEIATLVDTPSRLPAEEDQSQSKNQQSLDRPQAIPSPYFDWRNYKSGDWTTSVKNQGGCGACWSFSAVGVSEAAYNISTKNPIYDLDLAEQYHVAGCDSPLGCVGCCGGWNNVALEEIRDHGIPDESCLPFVDNSGCSCDGGVGDNECCYTGNGPCSATCNYYSTNCSDKTCSNRCSDWASRLTTIKTVGTIADDGEAADRTAMKKYLLEKGPLSIAFDASNGGWYSDYEDENTVYYCDAPDNQLVADHAVVITGYDDNHGGDGFWIVKNSWGSDWGWEEDGYFKIVYGSCLVEKSGVYYAEAGTPEWAVQNSGGTDVASINALGTMVLKGTCSAGGTCTAPANSFIVQNSAGETVGYIDSNGNLCVESGDCSDLTANCNSPSGQAFIVKDSAGSNVAYIDQTGDLCLTGYLIENGSP